MSLSPTRRWRDTAKAGSAEPVLLFEFKPTALYQEKNYFGDWEAVSIGCTAANLNTVAATNPANEKRDSMNLIATDELRLQTADVEAAAQANYGGDIDKFAFAHIRQTGEYRVSGYGHVTADVELLTFGLVQIVSFDRAFQIKKLYIGLYNNNATFTSRTNIKIYGNLDLKPDTTETEKKKTSEVYKAIVNQKPLYSTDIDHSRDSGDDDSKPEIEEGSTAYAISDTAEVYVETRGSGASKRTLYWRVIDLTEENIWMPGGNVPCAITITPAGDAPDLDQLEAWGSNSREDYTGGDFYRYNAELDIFECPDASLAFKFVAYGYTASTGTAYWTFTQDRDSRPGETGELELRFCQPKGTVIKFFKREGGTLHQCNAASWPTGTVSDSVRISQRYVQIKVEMLADSDYLDTPRLYSIRAVFKRSDKFLLANKSLFGYPNTVAEAPDYTAEGEPLSGAAKSTDTSRIVMLDPGGMISRMFEKYPMKNDKIRVKLGFNTLSFLEIDYLDFKTVWIEDWEPGDGFVTIHGYDQQVRFRNLKVPTSSDPPEQTEKIHYNAMSPAAIKRDLLMRARIRPSEIDYDPDSDGNPQDSGSFYNLHTKYDWSLDHVVEKPESPQKIDQKLNQHLLGFMTVGESGKWVSRYVDVDASPNADTEAISGDDILVDSEHFNPGLRGLKNNVGLFFGGTGNDQTKYRKIAISGDPDRASAKKYGEHNPDHLMSDFIPISTDENSSMLRTITSSRRIIQQDGYRTIEFSTGLKFAYLQIGDHISFTSTHYKRAGMTDLDSANPLLVLLCRKNITPDISAINWMGLVLLDNEQSATIDSAVGAPSNLEITLNGDGTIDWDFDASDDDDGSAGQKYELFQRLAARTIWEQPKIIETADGSSSYTVEDSKFGELVRYDFAVRFVNETGRKSAYVVSSDNLLTAPSPGTAGTDDWELNPVAGGVEVWVSEWGDGLADAHHVWVYREAPQYPEKRFIVGTILRNTDRKNTFIFKPPDPMVRKLWTFSLVAVNKWNNGGTRSSYKRQVNFQLMSGTQVLGAPTLADDGTHPLISRNAIGPYQGFTITHKITAPSGQADLVAYYEIWRQDDGGVEDETSGYMRIPTYHVQQNDASVPGAITIYYENHDQRGLKPGWNYDYQCRAVGKNGIPGTFSDTVSLELTDDTTGPDTPTITVTQIARGNRILVSAPAQGEGACPDVAFCEIQGYESVAAAWVTLVTGAVGSADGTTGGVDWTHRKDDIDIGESWKYRARYKDHSGNPTDSEDGWSDESASIVLGYVTKLKTSGSDNYIELAGTGQESEHLIMYAGGNQAAELIATELSTDRWGGSLQLDGEYGGVYSYRSLLHPYHFEIQAEDSASYYQGASLNVTQTQGSLTLKGHPDGPASFDNWCYLYGSVQYTGDWYGGRLLLKGEDTAGTDYYQLWLQAERVQAAYGGDNIFYLGAAATHGYLTLYEIISGTSYERFFADRDSVRMTQDSDTVDYDMYLRRCRAGNANISDNDTLGTIHWQGKVNGSYVTFAQLQAYGWDADTGTEDSYIRLGLIAAGAMDGDIFEFVGGAGWLDIKSATGSYRINSVKVIGPQSAHIADAVNAAGNPPTQAEFNALVAVVNALLLSDETHGLRAGV